MCTPQATSRPSRRQRRRSCRSELANMEANFILMTQPGRGQRDTISARFTSTGLPEAALRVRN